MDGKAPFKICPACRTEWADLDEFLSDPDLELAGYQPSFYDLEAGHFCFTHLRDGCHTTMAVPLTELTAVSPLRITKARTRVNERCPNYCTRFSNLEPCTISFCECHWVREMMQRIRSWPKKKAVPA